MIKLIPSAERISMAQAAEQLGTCKITISRWTTHGVHGVRLRTQRLGGRVFTCALWIDEFVEAQNPEVAS